MWSWKDCLKGRAMPVKAQKCHWYWDKIIFERQHFVFIFCSNIWTFQMRPLRQSCPLSCYSDFCLLRIRHVKTTVKDYCCIIWGTASYSGQACMSISCLFHHSAQQHMVFIVSLHTQPYLKTVSNMYLLMVCKVDGYPQVLGCRYTHINQAVIVIFFISLHCLKAQHKHKQVLPVCFCLDDCVKCSSLVYLLLYRCSI